MTYELRIVQKPTYLHAVVTGRNTKENVVRYLEEIHRECVARGYSKVLIEESLEGPRLGTIAVFKIASQGSRQVRGQLKAIGYVDTRAEGDLTS